MKTIKVRKPAETHTEPSEQSTRDIYFTSAAIEEGNPLLRIESNGRQGIFVFEQTPKLLSTITKYFNGQLRLDPKRLFENLKALKSQVYSAIGDVR